MGAEKYFDCNWVKKKKKRFARVLLNRKIWKIFPVNYGIVFRYNEHEMEANCWFKRRDFFLHHMNNIDGDFSTMLSIKNGAVRMWTKEDKRAELLSLIGLSEINLFPIIGLLRLLSIEERKVF